MDAAFQGQLPGLSLDVKTALDGKVPVVGTIGVSGRLECGHELDIDDTVTVSISNADGNVIAHGTATIVSVPPIGHRPANGPAWNERRHKAKIDDEQG